MAVEMRKKYSISHISRLRMGIDGKGIRTLILTYGCPLRCKYCINPTTWDNTGKYEIMSAKEVFERIAIDMPYFIATNGGITFGGGEPLLQPELIVEIRQLLVPEVTVNVETSLHVEWNKVEQVINSVDMFYVDIKSVFPDVYRAYTEHEIVIAMENLQKLLSVKGADCVVVRIPKIPGVVDSEMQNETKKVLEELGVRKFDLFQYRV